MTSRFAARVAVLIALVYAQSLTAGEGPAVTVASAPIADDATDQLILKYRSDGPNAPGLDVARLARMRAVSAKVTGYERTTDAASTSSS
jgi:hypothetical protein